MPNRLVIGLTGGIGTGKSAVANIFASFGASIIDTDEIAHSLTRSEGIAIPALVREFGPEYMDSTGALNRVKMRNLVFSDRHAKEILEGILHPMINAVAMKKLEQATGVYALLVVPLLIEFYERYKDIIDRVLVVDCDEDKQLQRVIHRGLDEKNAKAIIASQVSRAKRLAFASDVIDNNGDIQSLTTQVSKLHEYYVLLGERLI